MAEWYCSALALGGGVGSSVDPWTLAEGNTAWGDGTVGTTDRLNLKADAVYTTGELNWTVNGLANKKVLEGYLAAAGDGGKATIQRSAGAAVLMTLTSLNSEFRNLIIDGQDSGTLNLGIFGAYNRVRNIESHSAGSDGIGLTFNTYGQFINCYSHDNAGRGIYGYNHGRVSNCLTVDNVGYGIYTLSAIVNSISKGSTAQNFLAAYGVILNCISDGGSNHGIDTSLSTVVLNCIAINSPVGKYGINLHANSGGAFNCDFFDNDADINDATRNFNGQTVDPQFTDPDNLDYTRTGTNLDDLGFSEIGMVAAADYGIDIGPDQKVAPDYPAVTDVEDGVVFDHGAKEGTFEAPAEDDVLDGVDYGAGGTEFEGDVELPAEADVESGVGYGSGGTEYEGELVISRVESPISLKVQDDRVILEVSDG